MKIMLRTGVLGVVLFTLMLTGCPAETPPQHLTMRWGIPEEVEGFEGLEREPEGVEVDRKNEDTLSLVWHLGDSYILPISATAGEALEGVRYSGENISSHLEIEWLDPREGQWYPLEAVPEDRIKAEIEKDNQFLSLDFGPPQGADFEENMNRVIWFRVTPTELEEVEMEIYGYIAEEEDAATDPVSNTISLEAEIKEE